MPEPVGQKASTKFLFLPSKGIDRAPARCVYSVEPGCNRPVAPPPRCYLASLRSSHPYRFRQRELTHMRNRAFASCRRPLAFVCAGLTAFVCGAFAPATAAPSISPTLISVSSGSTRAVVLESVSMRNEPFSLSSEGNFSPNDARTRITLFRVL
jgi:hypothetical protein